MQNILIPLKLEGVLGTPVDTYGQPWQGRQSIVRGMQANIQLMLFGADGVRYTADDLDFASWDFVIAHDWVGETPPQLRVTEGITVDDEGVVNIPLLETNTEELIEKLGNNESITLGCELVGFKEGNDKPIFCCQWNIAIRNRRSDAGTGIPTPVGDSTYNKAQIDALLADKADLVDVIVYSAGTGIDITDGVIGIDTTGASTGQILKKTADGVAWANESGGASYTAGTGIDITDNAISIDTTGASTGQVLTKTASGLVWADAGSGLPDVSSSDNDKILQVVNGAWDKADAPVSATTANVQGALGIDATDGDASKVLSQKGTFVNMSSGGGGTSYTEGLGIDITNGAISIDVTGASAGQILRKTESGLAWQNETAELPTVTGDDNGKILGVVSGVWGKADAPISATATNVQGALGIDATDGSTSKVLSQKGTYVDLPDGVDGAIEVLGTAPAAATASDVGRVIFYTGASTADFVQNHFYRGKQSVVQSGNYVVSGAGMSQFNGTYTPTGSTHNNQPVYSYQPAGWWTMYLYYQANSEQVCKWVMCNYVDDNGNEQHDGFYKCDTIDGTWVGIEGAQGGTAPTVTAQSQTSYVWDDVTDDFVQTALGIDTSNGDTSKVLSKRGTFVDLPSGASYTEGLGIDITDNAISIDITGATTGQKLTKTADGIAWQDDIAELPTVTSTDNDKVLTVVNGAWTKGDLPEPEKELPAVSSSDNGKILSVVSGIWSKTDSPISATSANVKTALGIGESGSAAKFLNEKGNFAVVSSGTSYTAGTGISLASDVISIDTTGASVGQVLKKTASGLAWQDDDKGDTLPTVSSTDNSKVLTVVDGVWNKSDAPISATATNVQTALGIDTVDGSTGKVLSQKGTYVDLPSGGGGNAIEVLDTAPTSATASDVGRVIFYIGASTADFAQNHFYRGKQTGSGGAAGYQVSGAGKTEINGIYTPTGNNHNNQPIYAYVNGDTTYYLYYQQNDDGDYSWVIYNDVYDSAGPDFDAYYRCQTITGTWTNTQCTYAGATPAPGVTAYSGISYSWEDVTDDIVQSALGIDTVDGSTGKVLSKRGTFVDLPDGLPSVTTADNGKVLTVVNGVWTAV